MINKFVIVTKYFILYSKNCLEKIILKDKEMFNKKNKNSKLI